MKLLRVFFGLLLTGQVLAMPLITVKGTIEHDLVNKATTKKLKFLQISLTKQAKKNFKQAITTQLKQQGKPQLAVKSSRLPAHVQLGMNHVPVLDQGFHGTCVTFAVTGAFDALIGEGDYISQLCMLALGNHIANNSNYRPSGWDGTDADTALSRFAEYGIVSKAQEKIVQCGGLSEYPLQDDVTAENEMNLVDYHQASVGSNLEFNADEDFYRSKMFQYDQKMLNMVSMDNILADVKTALYQQDRVLIAVLVPLNDLVGLEATYHAEHDTWALIGRTEYLAERAIWDASQWGQWGGHEMIITGYDDDAIATDEDGMQHRGLLTLRNSWGAEIGDSGNFYMTYDYFKALTLDLVRIGNMRNSS